MKALFAAAFFLCTTGAAWAHPTGNERRTKEDCERLEKGMNKHKMKACMTCVGKEGHHFHPAGKKGKRCMINAEEKAEHEAGKAEHKAEKAEDKAEEKADKKKE